VGLPFAVVGILSQDYDLHLAQGGVGEGIEELPPCGKNTFTGFFFCAQEGLQCPHIGLIELPGEFQQPALL
jgi:hypothetical protein